MEYFERINDAIGRLRSRKNRPDVENILGLLNKKATTIQREELEIALTELAQMKKILRVHYKGHFSFRQVEAENDAVSSSQPITFSSDTEEDTQEKTEAFGIPIAETEEKSVTKMAEIPEEPQAPSEGRSEQTPTTPSPTPDSEKQDSRPQSQNSSDSDSIPDGSRKRKASFDATTPTTQRVSARKRVKKTHGPEWQTDSPQLACKVILSTCGVCRSKDLSSNLLTCSACKVSIHATCLQLTERSIAKISANKQFYCLRCKPCKVCKYHTNQELPEEQRLVMPLPTILNGNNIIHCCQCYSVFHMVCLKPPLSAKPKERPWMCRKCSYEANKKEKLKANAAATTMLMVAQQLPLETASNGKPTANGLSEPPPVDNNENAIVEANPPNQNTVAIKTEPEVDIPKETPPPPEAPEKTEEPKPEVKERPRRSEKNNNDVPNDANNSVSAKVPKKRHNALLSSEGAEGKRSHPRSEKNGGDSELRRKLLEIQPVMNKNAEKKRAAEPLPTAEPCPAVEVPRKITRKSEQTDLILSQRLMAPLEPRSSLPSSISVIPILPRVDEARKKDSTLVLTAAESVQSQTGVVNQILLPIAITAQPAPQPEQANTPRGLAQFEVRYPYVAEWTSEQVADFVTNIGYPKEAKVLMDQEIDGRSLMLLTRKDVVGSLGLKLGPAVKLFKHINNLQEVRASSTT